MEDNTITEEVIEETVPSKMSQFSTKLKKLASSDFSKSVGNITLDSIKMALALVVALAWNTAIKYLINSLWKYDNNNLIMHIIYAVIITIVFVAFITFAQKKFGYSGDARIQYAVVGM